MSVIPPSELEFLVSAIADRVAERLANQPRLVDRDGLASQLGISVPTVDRLRKAGAIPTVQVGGKPMFDVSAVIASLAISDEVAQ